MARRKIQGWDKVADQLFFNVEEVPLTAILPDDNLQISSHKAIIRTDNNEILSVVGSEYQLVKNEEVFTELYKALPSGGEITVKEAWTTNGGGRSFFELIMTNGHNSQIKAVGMPVANRLVVTNSYDRSRKFSLMAGLMVLECTNGMMSHMTRTELASFHLKSQDIYGKIDQVKEFVKIDSGRLLNYERYAKAMISDPGECIKQMAGLIRFPEKYEQAVVKRAEKSLKNYWDLYQCFTETITHDMDSPQRRLQFEFRLDREFETAFDRWSN